MVWMRVGGMELWVGVEGVGIRTVRMKIGGTELWIGVEVVVTQMVLFDLVGRRGLRGFVQMDWWIDRVARWVEMHL